MALRLVLALTITIMFAASFGLRGRMEQPTDASVASPGDYRRIVSMAPNITETLYALGLGDRVVGVTRFCKYPPEAMQKPKIGGHLDPNFEAIVMLKPDLVIMLDEHIKSLPGFRKLGLKTHAVRHENVEDILEAIRSIGRVCGAANRGRRLADDLEGRLERIRRRTENAPKPRVLMVVDRITGVGRPADVYIAGPGSLSERLIELAGGINAYRGVAVAYPLISTEGILKCNPDVVVDLLQSLADTPEHTQKAIDDWRAFAGVTAVRQGRVYALDRDRASSVGPRMILAVEELARLLHPEIDWSAP
jgi:iron complex transport system substrate-binding protein